MLPQDQFDRRFDELVATLSSWSDALRDAADVTTETTQAYWRLRLDPRASGTCPVEIILHRNQTYDMMVGQEAYEGLALDDIATVERLLKAISKGDLTTRIARSAATDQPIAVTTIVGRDASPLFERTRNLAARPSSAGQHDALLSAAVTHQRHYTPYRRQD